MRRCAFCNSVRVDTPEPCYSCGKEGETRIPEVREKFAARSEDEMNDLRRRMSESAKVRWAKHREAQA